MSQADRDALMEKLYAGMARHVEDGEDPSMMVGDMESLLFAAMEQLDDEAFEKFTQSAEVAGILEWNELDDVDYDAGDNVTVGGEDADDHPWAEDDEDDD